MRNIIMILFLIGGALTMFSSCYDDKGSYMYSDINDVQITLPASVSVQIPLIDSILVEITPEISQLQLEGDANLRYLWKRQFPVTTGSQTWRESGREKTFRLWVKPTDQSDIRLRLTVTDTIQNIESYRDIVLNMIFPFSNTWFVLQNVNGNAVLGCVDGMNKERIAVKDVYFEKTGEQLRGEPRCLAINNQHFRPGQEYPVLKESMLQVFTVNNGLQLDANTMFVRYPYNMMLIDKYNNSDNNYKPQYATSDCAGEVIIDNGVFWYAMHSGLSIYYPVKLAADAGTSYRATMASAINDKTCYVFDDENKRFLCYNNSNRALDWWNQRKIRGGAYNLYGVNSPANAATLDKIGENSDARNVFNPDNIGSDKEVVYMGATTNTDATKSIAIARSGNTAHVYEFNVDGLSDGRTPRCSGYFTFSPQGDMADCHFTSSSYFDKICFYASGNKIYRVDLNRAVPSSIMIYEYPDPSAKISKIDFCSNRGDIGYDVSETEFVFNNINKILGVAVNKGDGESVLLEMKLTGGGEVAKESNGTPAIYEFSGFKNIVDIKFMYK